MKKKSSNPKLKKLHNPKLKELHNPKLKESQEKSDLHIKEDLEYEEMERRVLLAQSKANRIRIVKRFREYAKSILTDNETNQKLLRINRWFSEQGLSHQLVSYFCKTDPDFKEIYEEGKQYFAELNAVGAQTHYLKESMTMWLLPKYSEEYKEHFEWINKQKKSDKGSENKEVVFRVEQVPVLESK